MRTATPVIERPEVLATPPSAAIEMTDIHKDYLGSTVISGLNLTVPRGQIVTLTGFSGSGKSTTLRMAAQIEQPTSGIIKILGKDTVEMDDRQRTVLVGRHIGIVLQSPSLLGNFSVLDNITNPARGRGILVEPSRVADLVTTFGFGTKQKLLQKASTLSGGEQMRVALMRAMVTSQELLLLDEPTTGLDPERAVAVFALLRQVSKDSGTTVVAVTHDAVLSRQFADRQIVMDSGRIVEDQLFEAVGDAA